MSDPPSDAAHCVAVEPVGSSHDALALPGQRLRSDGTGNSDGRTDGRSYVRKSSNSNRKVARYKGGVHVTSRSNHNIASSQKKREKRKKS